MSYYIYKHLDVNNCVIYVGQSININQRCKDHLRSSGWKNKIDRILVAEVPNKFCMDFYEKYLIRKLQPQYNIADKDDQCVDIIEPKELEFKEFGKDKIVYTKEEIEEENKMKLVNYYRQLIFKVCIKYNLPDHLLYTMYYDVETIIEVSDWFKIKQISSIKSIFLTAVLVLYGEKMSRDVAYEIGYGLYSSYISKAKSAFLFDNASLDILKFKPTLKLTLYSNFGEIITPNNVSKFSGNYILEAYHDNYFYSTLTNRIEYIR